ncbi:MAG: HlyD family secretion protein [Alphaproteobacteria bacterium]|nr:HlyD family secretion protein [Alphaproteobacteria bacterium]MBU1515323.1 HlyD family secretion protein [Alphaproteobacteria bacterium]MBU2095373.1 HlyD family secretion protein [Alphaproteobacteria bacterium]MBU2152607.1 HlyD family secretion protein [Alphaproteobacteria bacterium]MBU2310003.1 HlyD family secretion protein [Alphaproteobacteria bacterium]
MTNASGPGAAPPVWRPSRHRPVTIAVIVALTLAVVLAILAAWGLPPFGGGGVATENAYVRGRTTVIAPQVSGYVTEVVVHDYDTVSRDQVLVRIDDRVYAARVAQARANLAAQEAALANAVQARAARAAGVQGQSAGLTSAQAQLLRARADMARANDLVRDGSISVRERDQTLAALRAAEAGVRQASALGEIARQDLRTVEVSKGGLEAQVEGARAQLRLAEIDLENTRVRAPEAGQVGEVGVRLGQYVTNGVQLVSLVPAERWVIANYKEAQTRGVYAGQRALLRVDALGGAKLKGHVERLSPAAGSEFAVLKPDNATGNFVKVPQRIGVRIAIDPGQPLAAALRPGMSVEARVYVRGGGS